MQNNRGLRYTIYTLFILSGVSGLIYQIVWTRLLVLVFGNTLLATSTVLSAFMGGLAAGSYLLGRYIDRKDPDLIRLYAFLEIGIGVYALAFPWLLTGVTPLYSAIYGGVAGNIVMLNLARFLVCFVLIGIPTFMMGGTLPILIKRFTSGRDSIGNKTGFLYGLNTSGAVLGTVACGYFLLRVFGMRTTTLVGVAINVGVGIVALLIASRARPGTTETAVAAEGPTGEKVGFTASPAVKRMVLIGIGLSGFCALAYEVFWARMLNLFLHNNIYSFTAILATFLVGIAIGSLLYANWLSRLRNQVGLFVGLQVGIGTISYVTPFLFQALHGSLFNDFSESMTLWKTAVVMIGPTIMMGIAVPLAVHICQRGANQEGTSVGNVYSVNTVGAIFGAFAAGFILLPLMGLHNGVILVASLNLVAGALPLISSVPFVRRPIYAVATAAVILVAFLAAPADLFRGLFEKSHPSADLIHYQEGKIANVVVYDFWKNGYKDLHLNAVEEASSRLWHVQLFKMLGILPVMVHDEPDNALMIAFGAGMSAGATVNYVTEFEVVDLNPDIEGVANAFKRENLDVYNHPTFTQVVNDGRNALLLSDKEYSLIISDATNPKMFDSWTLYSQEFYELVKSRLKPGGVFCQWVLIPLPGDSIKTILNTFRSVFPHMSFWVIHGSSQVLMLGTPERLEIDYAKLKTRLEPIYEESGLAEFGVDSVEKFLSFFMLGEDGVGEMLKHFNKISTDDLPHAQFHIDLDDAGIEASLDIVRNQESILPYLTNTESASRELPALMATYEKLARRLNLGFLLGDPMQFRGAQVVDHDANLDDPNVKCSLNFGPEKKRYFTSRVANHPDDLNARNTLGFIHLSLGELDEAEAQFTACIERKPDFAIASINLGRVFLARGDFDKAEAKIVEARKMNPTRRFRRLLDSQLEILRLARRAHYLPESAEDQRKLGVALYNDGQLLEAVLALRKAADLDPLNPAITNNLASIYENHDLLDGLATEYRMLAKMRPSNTAILERRDELAALIADSAKRRAWYSSRIPRVQSAGEDSGADSHPPSCDAALASWHDVDFEGSITRENLEKAAALYEESTVVKPDDLHAWIDAATIREILGQFDRAAELWQGAGRVSKDNRLANVQSRRLSLMQQISEKEDAASLAEVGNLYRMLGNRIRSREFLNRAVGIDPSRQDTWWELAQVCEELGRFEEAASATSRVLELAPDHAEARTLQDRLQTFGVKAGQ